MASLHSIVFPLPSVRRPWEGSQTATEHNRCINTEIKGGKVKPYPVLQKKKKKLTHNVIKCMSILLQIVSFCFSCTVTILLYHTLNTFASLYWIFAQNIPHHCCITCYLLTSTLHQQHTEPQAKSYINDKIISILSLSVLPGVALMLIHSQAKP